MEHTRGLWKWNWKINDRLECECGIYSEYEEGQAVSICRAPRYEKEKQWEANALLITAAPDLLKACKEVANWAETASPIRLIQELDIVIKKVNQAISKAEKEMK
jgi:hypothetical protein